MLSKRKIRHNKKDIKMFMIQRELTNRKIADWVGVSDQAVSNFICGRMQSEKIRGFFQMMGCPVFCQEVATNA
jgi:predicted XRE-type DNA-binding protein